jgi:Cd2+/Zn2+-exporting ATPase
MRFSMDLSTQLSSIGFSENEAKVYLELLSDYPTTGYKLAKNAGIPRSMVYETLGRLSNRGAILETREDRTTLYRPIPPNILLDLHEEAQRHLITALRTGLAERFAPHEEDHLWTMNGDRPVLVYAIQMVRKAQSKILAVLSDVSLEVLRKELRDAHLRGVAVNAVLTGSNDLGFGTEVKHPQFESELQQLSRTTMLVVDGKEVMIANAPGSAALETSATITRNRQLLMVSSQFIWMEMFAQRLQHLIGGDLLSRLSPEDRGIFEAMIFGSASQNTANEASDEGLP